MAKQSERLNDVISKATGSDFAEQYPEAWNTVLRVTGLHADSQTAQSGPTIVALTVIGTDDDHTIFGLSKDSKPYVWHDGGWIIHG